MKINPCPWCGIKGKASRSPHSKKWVVECVSEDCGVSPMTWLQDTRKGAIEAWNKRKK